MQAGPCVGWCIGRCRGGAWGVMWMMFGGLVNDVLYHLDVGVGGLVSLDLIIGGVLVWCW